MPPSRVPPRFRRAAATVLAMLSWFGVAATTAAAMTDGTSPGPASATTIEQWKGRFCTATSCRNVPASPLGAAASFGAAILAIGWLARRPATRTAAPDSSVSGPFAPSSE